MAHPSSVSAALRAAIANEIARPVSPAASAMAAAIRKRHSKAGGAILFYGSCLRDQAQADGVLDFYLLVDDYRHVYDKPLPRLANELLPPNVFYIETTFEGRPLRAKYAVMSLREFSRAAGLASRLPSIWARFAQPSALVWSDGPGSRDLVIEALSACLLTMVERTLPLIEGPTEPTAFWTVGFRASYGTELRAEASDRAARLVAHDAERYRRMLALALDSLGPGTARLQDGQVRSDAAPAEVASGRRWWRRARRLGKLHSIPRLAKSAFTFEDGLDYILWKIERHSGVHVEASDWQRRHPLLAALPLAWSLYRRGAFR